MKNSVLQENLRRMIKELKQYGLDVDVSFSVMDDDAYTTRYEGLGEAFDIEELAFNKIDLSVSVEGQGQDID